MKDIKKSLLFDEQTGEFFWIDAGNQMKSKKAGTVDKTGYLIIMYKGKCFKAHRLAWWWVNGEFPSGHVDHIDRNKQNNKLINLRVVSNLENNKNAVMRKDNTSGYTGILDLGNRYKVQIRTSKKRVVKTFSSLSDAICFRDKTYLENGFSKMHGEYV